MNVAITGISGYIGQLLTEKLDRDERVGRIVGIDIGEFVNPSPKLKHYRVDIRDTKLGEVFDENEVDVVVHLAFILNPVPDPTKQRDVNVNGSRNVLQAAMRSGVRKFIFASSTTVYGAHPDNPEWLTEAHPLRPNVQYAREKAEVEQMCQEFARSEGATVTIPRLCTVMGAHINNPLIVYARAIRRGVAFRIGDFATIPIQLVHEADAGQAFYEATVSEHPGVYNLAADGVIDLEYVKSKKIGTLRVPVRAVEFTLDLTRRLGIQYWEPSVINYIRYRWTASNERIKREWGFEFEHTTASALEYTLKMGIGFRRALSSILPYVHVFGHPVKR